MRIASAILIFVFFVTVLYAQAPENPLVLKRKIDSLYTVIKNIPESTTSKNDTIRLNTVFELIRKIPDDTSMYYLNYSLRKCDAYSSFVINIEKKSISEVQEAIKKDNYLYYYLNLKARLLRYAGGHEKNDEDKLKYFLRALKISEKTESKLGEASAYLSICYVYYKQSVFTKAIENLLIAQSIYRQVDRKDLLAVSYRTLGEIYGKQKLIDKAIENFTIGLGISKKIHNLFMQGVFYERIGNCYIELGDYRKAIDNHFASLKVSEQLKDVKGVGDSYSDIAAIYLSMKDYPKSLINFVGALNKYKEFADPEHIANGYKDVANANYMMHKNDIALSYLDSALAVYQKEEIDYMVALCYSLISDVYADKHEASKSLDFMNKEIAVSKKYGFLELLRDTYKKLATVYVAQSDYKTAYHYHVLYTEMKDSFANSGDETVENITVMQTKFDKEKTEQEKLLHEAVVAQKEAKLEQEKTQRYALYGGLVLVMAFSVFVLNRFRVTQRQKLIIEKQKHMVDTAFKNLEQKNKEVMDSITYARRIQRALITSELYIEKQLNRLTKGDKL